MVFLVEWNMEGGRLLTTASSSTGCCGFCDRERWHDLPERYGKYKSVRARFMRWFRVPGCGSASSPTWWRTRRTST